MIDEDVAPLFVDREAVVAGAINARHRRRDEHGLRRFGPGIRLHDVRIGVRGQQAEAVARIGRAGRIGDEQLAVARQQRGRFSHLVALDFPVERRHRNPDRRLGERDRRRERREIQVAVGLDPRLALCPAQIARAVVDERGRIEVEAVPRRLELAQHRPARGHRIGAVGDQRIGADAEHVLTTAARAGGEIHDPTAVDQVQLGCPDKARQRAAGEMPPEDLLARGGQPGERARTPQHQPVVFGHRPGQVVIAVGVPENLRIRALADDRIARHRSGGGGDAGQSRDRAAGRCGGCASEKQAAVQIRHRQYSATGQPSAPQFIGAIRSVGAPFFVRSYAW